MIIVMECSKKYGSQLWEVMEGQVEMGAKMRSTFVSFWDPSNVLGELRNVRTKLYTITSPGHGLLSNHLCSKHMLGEGKIY